MDQAGGDVSSAVGYDDAAFDRSAHRYGDADQRDWELRFLSSLAQRLTARTPGSRPWEVHTLALGIDQLTVVVRAWSHDPPYLSRLLGVHEHLPTIRRGFGDVDDPEMARGANTSPPVLRTISAVRDATSPSMLSSQPSSAACLPRSIGVPSTVAWISARIRRAPTALVVVYCCFRETRSTEIPSTVDATTVRCTDCIASIASNTFAPYPDAGAFCLSEKMGWSCREAGAPGWHKRSSAPSRDARGSAPDPELPDVDLPPRQAETLSAGGGHPGHLTLSHEGSVVEKLADLVRPVTAVHCLDDHSHRGAGCRNDWMVF